MVRIPLGHGQCAYGRQVGGEYVEFFDLCSDCGALLDLREVVNQPVIFRVTVLDWAFKRAGSWELLKVVPLSPTESEMIYDTYTLDTKSGRYRIDSFHATLGPLTNRWVMAREECNDSEERRWWTPMAIEARLRDHFGLGVSDPK